jgi:hypothetical protein
VNIAGAAIARVDLVATTTSYVTPSSNRSRKYESPAEAGLKGHV